MAFLRSSIFFLLAGLACFDLVAPFPNLKRQTVPGLPTFNAAQQLVSTSGAHAWIAPKSTDQRGPCPGLNAAANHGYIPRNGIVTMLGAINGINAAWGVSFDLGNVLAAAGIFLSGDGVTFSIGGPPAPNLIAGGLLGQPVGISYSHNKFEGDGSPSRGDLYQFGNDYLLQLRLFQGMLDLPVDPEEPNYTFEVLKEYAPIRHRQSVSENPYYMRGVIGVTVPPGTLALIGNLFSNKSAEYPSGFLSADTLKSIFSVSGPSGALVYTPGHERIPNNFYKWNPNNEYSVAKFGLDLGDIYRTYPSELSFGGNTGTVNSFTPIDTASFSGGVYNAQNLAQGNNYLCFLYQNTRQLFPELLLNGGIIADIVGAVSRFNAAIGPAITTLGCPQLANYQADDSQLENYPGWTQLGQNGRY